MKTAVRSQAPSSREEKRKALNAGLADVDRIDLGIAVPGLLLLVSCLHGVDVR